MKSDLPKVLQPLGGKPLLAHVIAIANELDNNTLHVVYGHGGERVKQQLADVDVTWVEQAEQLGTGHAVQQAMPHVADDQIALVLYGDVPLIRSSTLQQLVDAAQNCIAVLTAKLDNPQGYGRIIRGKDDDGVTHIVEQKDATAEEQAVNEINTGLLACPANKLKTWLDKLNNNNAQGEYYLTDIIAMAVADKVAVKGIVLDDNSEAHGVNDRLQLAQAETIHRQRYAEQLMRDGVTLIDPARIDVRGELICGKDVVIDVNAVFEGKVVLGDRVHIGPHTVIRNAEIATDTQVLSHTHIEEAIIGKQCRIGPFARLRPGTKLADEARIGNFVELKKCSFGKGSKANHLSYIGDAEVGQDVNIGCGTITCNYDGANKHRTVIEDGAFIGSATQLVAPVTVGKNATIGAGTTLCKDAPAGELTLSRAKQIIIKDWQRPVKEKKAQD